MCNGTGTVVVARPSILLQSSYINGGGNGNGNGNGHGNGDGNGNGNGNAGELRR